MKAQMKAANTAGAAYALIIGEDEVGAGAVTMRDLETGAQTAIPESEIVSAITP
jgi:histidyl-tRNA synthetase